MSLPFKKTLLKTILNKNLSQIIIIFVIRTLQHIMNYYISDSQDPFFNIASEEYLLKMYDKDFFFLYINQPALIVGKHQNTLAEINLDKVEAENIPVIRRLSGGGTVFHDLGNLNYCFIKKGEKGKLVNFKKYSEPIINALQKLEVNAKFEGKSDLTIDGKKFSGNASHVYRNKVMQHGTMLFSSDLKRLNQLLKVNPLKFKDRGVRSIRSRVTNISDYLLHPISINQLAEHILSEIKNIYPTGSIFQLSDSDKQAINKLKEEKYKSLEWNFGYSPTYTFEKISNFSGGRILEIEMKVSKGRIESIELAGNCINKEAINEFYEHLKGVNHTKFAINKVISNNNVNLYFNNLSSSELLQVLF